MLDHLKEEIKKYSPGVDLSILDKAYVYAKKAHEGQLRASGEPFIEHPLEVAKILVDLRMDVPTICAAFLHDTIEDTKISTEEIKMKFGDEVASLVESVTKLSGISPAREENNSKKKGTYIVKQETRARNLRKVLLAMAKDIRVILIKLADRLHNLRTLDSLMPTKRKIIARETLDIFAPLTSRLGLWHMKWELEDLAFRHLYPEEYVNLVRKIAKKRLARERVVKDVIEIIHQKLKEEGIGSRIEGRPKHLYSIYHKMNRKEKEFSEIYDLFAIRIIVDTVSDCYAALGVVHGLWMPIKDRIKDYIAKPKTNNYRSLHTTVYGPEEHPLEIQIRTKEMHKINEYGIAAHWAYKEGVRSFTHHKEVFPWISRILDWKDDSKDAREYIQNLKLDLLKSQVFVFTPKGDVLDLPAGSTSIDFAYRIHTDVGNHCVGAKVNAKIIPLEYQLQNGDIVEVITSKHSTPSLDWLKICKSNHARNKIRNWFKKEKREENVSLGLGILERELKRQKLDRIPDKDEILLKVAKKLKFPAFDDLLASIGYGGLSFITVINKLRDELPKKETEIFEVPKKIKRIKSKVSSAVVVKGVDNILVKYAKCCSPVYGDEIKGYITLGKGVSIHRSDCPNLSILLGKKERIIEVSWVHGYKGVFTGVEIEIECWDRAGLLGDIMGIVSSHGISLTSCKAFARKTKAIIKLCMDVSDIGQLENVMQKIMKINGVLKVTRVTHIK